LNTLPVDAIDGVDYLMPPSLEHNCIRPCIFNSEPVSLGNQRAKIIDKRCVVKSLLREHRIG